MPRVPSYWQLDPRWDWGRHSNRANNCGPTCLMDVIKAYEGQLVPADRIHDELYGDSHQGYTYVLDLARYLVGRGHTVRWGYGYDRAHYRQQVRAALSAGDVMILLQVFDRKRLSGGHFVVADGYSGQKVYLANPWGRDDRYGHYGLREWVTWDELCRLSKGFWWIRVEYPQGGKRVSYPRATFVRAQLRKGSNLRTNRYTDSPLVWTAPEVTDCWVATVVFPGGDWQGRNDWRLVKVGKMVAFTHGYNVINERSK